MKVYLVGGAVRDALLGEVVHEQDWVVVGSTPDALLKLGYQQVGRDFPVFLHPKTKEEYALARTERKAGGGYHGFVCDANPNVTLEEDLARRDLTINAIAKDEAGVLIDPYQGVRDLETKTLRHVSPAFIEDPVRVLRLARFAARFHHFGFSVANETLALMQHMVQQGELLHLVPERVWQEWQKSLSTKNPEVFIKVLLAAKALYQIFPELEAGNIEMMLKRLLAVTACSDKPVIRFAAFTAGLGDKKQLEAFCRRLRVPNEYRELAVLVVLYGDLIQEGMDKEADAIVGALEQVDAFRKPERFLDLLTVSEARTIVQDRWQLALNACNTVDIGALVAEGHQGEAMKKALHVSRVAAVKSIL
ncbi:MAG: multifunctional CCA tRNA nucleotidyl transferase/2'3'-cyclic phosphodiesterase/2'nucleotidase/phosphatase [Gammaproteobacteria bacterium]|nr:multifunctional CCA tRNA nucleotidyl transferase/2'3'-cyclic phosphodiesterase/2'nucleotidase/phosphatase [Gammaproteobacteria bacterium]